MTHKPMAASRDVKCLICPKECVISDGQAGDCRVRVNRDGRLLATTYGLPCALHVDPIEKKPLAHFLPGSRVFSLATAGCNLHCKNCQNWEISQSFPLDVRAESVPPSEVVRLAKQSGALSVAYTYTDPVIFYEYALETSERAREAGLRNVLVTAAYINPKPLRRLCQVTDAANADLKFMDDALYRSNCDASLKPVLDALVILREEGVWLEVTNLIIPTLNDESRMIERLCRWIFENLGPDVPIHFSRFHPVFQLRHLPVTPEETLERAYRIAADCGVRHCYIGNLHGSAGENTHCPACGATVVRRVGYRVLDNLLSPEGKCPKCGEGIAGVWK
jgi:pyruvate formate lyase activating enzyme